MIVVTGMHRSGTSAVAMTMEALGVDFGDHRAFYGADEWNKRGYFERSDVIDCNSRLVTGVPRTQGQVRAVWSQVAYLVNPSLNAVARRAPRLRPEMARLAARLEGTAVKDPRFCLTLGVWRPHVASVVVVLRHPAAVARSLRRRQRVPLALGLRFWDRHAAGLLQATLAHDTLFVDFDVLRGGDRGRATELGRMVSFLDLGLETGQAVARFEERFSERLVHFDADVEDLPSRTLALWRRLQQRRAGQL